MTDSAALSTRIIYEDNHLIAYNKRSGDICQGDKTGDEPLPEKIKSFIKERDHKPGNVFLGVIHRLDRPVSGLVLLAKTSKALERMNRLIQERALEKQYLAICSQHPDPPEGRLEHYLIKDQASNKSRIVREGTAGAKRAVLRYQLVSQLDHYSVLRIRLETGRHHQIRVQLASLGCPIRGDLKYGSKRSNPDGSISLHAWSLEFPHPVRGEMLCLHAPLPESDPLWKQVYKTLS